MCIMINNVYARNYPYKPCSLKLDKYWDCPVIECDSFFQDNEPTAQRLELAGHELSPQDVNATTTTTDRLSMYRCTI